MTGYFGGILSNSHRLTNKKRDDILKSVKRNLIITEEIKMSFKPNYQNLVDAAYNRMPERLPCYDHLVGLEVIGEIMGVDMKKLEKTDISLFFEKYCEFFKKMGYDTVSYEYCFGGVMPGSGALGGHKKGVIGTREDFENYPWDELPDMYMKEAGPKFCALRKAMPEGMMAVGGVGNGIFECVQDVVGYMDLCYIKADDSKLYEDIFKKVGEVLAKTWEKFMAEYGDIYCVLRFGDDLGFKSDTLISHEDIKELIIPQYRKITDIVHKYNKPFLLHSCGSIFDVMDDLIEKANINAKHSNEDVIAMFPEWVEKYGERIGNFGGIDTDMICRDDEKEVREYTESILKAVGKEKGIAFGTGNSVPYYVSITGYKTMNKAIRIFRGDDPADITY